MIKAMIFGYNVIDPSFNKVDASGGIISYFHQYKIHTFNFSDIFEVNSPGDVSVLLVGGGGRGGIWAGFIGSPGGGGGEVIETNMTLSIGNYNVSVGLGAFDPSVSVATLTSFNTTTALPGKNASDYISISSWKAGDSGSGKLGPAIYGYPTWASGGGGNSTDGSIGSSGIGGVGGLGTKSILGISYTGEIKGYGGGGGGWGSTTGGYGDDGGGTGCGYYSKGKAGTPNTGGGGGGQSSWPIGGPTSCAGGDGVVIIRYRYE